MLAFKQKIIIDNILYAFHEENEDHLLGTLEALTEELHGIHAKEKEKSKVVYLENPESAKIPMTTMKRSEWFKFHEHLGNGKRLPPTLSDVFGPYYERYLVNVQAEHPQKQKIWLLDNGFVHNL